MPTEFRVGRAAIMGCLALSAALLATPAAAAPPSPDEIRAQAHASLDDSLQTTMPGDPPAPIPSANPAASAPWAPSLPHADAPLPSASPFSAVARLLLYCLALGAVLLVVVALVREIQGRAREPGAATEAPATPGDRGQAATPISLSEAEALALAGQYAEAIHALLASVLGYIAGQGNIAVSPSTTSREVLSSVRLEEQARLALSDLVLTVEVSLFGGLDVGEGDYQRCMASYQRLSEALWAR